jgi:asparagine synthase (glutamine-hydrolysing)
MCGIAGMVATDRQFQAAASEVRRMCAEIVYRGPDDEGILAKDGVGLGMRRLSIIDVQGGHQPIPNEDNTMWIVFNGEIYNFNDLREDLESKGHQFRTHCDTEAILHAYEAYGPDCVRKLRGMFAFAIYDFKERTLFLGRDRLGKKPLHYALDRGILYFGSEIKSILAVAPQLGTVDQEALSQFFCYGYIPDPYTAFRAIRKLPPGHSLLFANGSLQIQKYWDVPEFGSLQLSEEDCLERLEHTLSEAVRIRLISEVPLGALLSGGVDSSVVVATMAKVSSTPVKTFSIGFSEEDFNETQHARAVAKRFGTEHHELVVKVDLWSTLEKLSYTLDEPFADSSIIPTFHVARMARQHVTVVLSGDGGDELFAGYDDYIVNYNRRHLDVIPDWVAPVYHKLVYPHIPANLRARKLVHSFPLRSRDRFVRGKTMFPSYDPELTLLTPEFLNSVAGYQPAENTARRYFDEAPASDIVSKMQYTDMKCYMTADVLTKVDRMSMANSLEVRCPLLDHVVVELAVQIPVAMKIRNGTRKYLLRKLAEKLGVPREALYRRKQGFSLPLKHWMRGGLKDDMVAVLLEPRTVARGYFRKSEIERTLKEHQHGEFDHSAKLWQLLIFELWHRNFLESKIPVNA